MKACFNLAQERRIPLLFFTKGGPKMRLFITVSIGLIPLCYKIMHLKTWSYSDLREDTGLAKAALAMIHPVVTMPMMKMISELKISGNAPTAMWYA